MPFAVWTTCMSSVNTATPLGKGRQLLVMDQGENYSKICFSRMNFDGPAALTLKIEQSSIPFLTILNVIILVLLTNRDEITPE